MSPPRMKVVVPTCDRGAYSYTDMSGEAILGI